MVFEIPSKPKAFFFFFLPSPNAPGLSGALKLCTEATCRQQLPLLLFIQFKFPVIHYIFPVQSSCTPPHIMYINIYKYIYLQQANLLSFNFLLYQKETSRITGGNLKRNQRKQNHGAYLQKGNNEGTIQPMTAELPQKAGSIMIHELLAYGSQSKAQTQAPQPEKN